MTKYFIMIIFLFTHAQILPAEKTQDKTLQYDVSVDAKVIPLFASDKFGNPVDDLSESEIRVQLNGIEIPISAFKRFQIKKNLKEAQPIIPDRMIFVIVDTVFNSRNGLRRSREIIRRLVETCNGNDSFVLLENSASGGLKYLLGPEKQRSEIYSFLKKYRPRREIWLNNLFSKNDLTNIQGGPAFNTYSSSQRKFEQMRYRNAIKRLGKSLSRIKYALKTIDRAKLTFLISEGPANKSFIEEVNIGPGSNRKTENFKLQFYRHLKNVASSVNNGGSILFTINPQSITKSVDAGSSGENGMRFMAQNGGGQYFEGSKTDRLISRIDRAISAYYEIFIPLPKEYDAMKLDITCSRKGVQINSLNHIERDLPYSDMELVQKKVFAVNAVTGGHWTRMVATVIQHDYNTISNNQANSLTIKKIEIALPPNLQNRSVDIFQIAIDPKTNETEISMVTRAATNPEVLEFNYQSTKQVYFAIVEPTTPVCIFNQLD